MNIPVFSKRKNLETLKSPTVVIKIETIIWFYDFIIKTVAEIEALQKSSKISEEPEIKLKNIPGKGSERKEYTRFWRNTRLVVMKQSNHKNESFIDKLKKINLKFSFNFFKVIVFIESKNVKQNLELEKNTKDGADIEGIQFMIENCWAAVEFVKHKVYL